MDRIPQTPDELQAQLADQMLLLSEYAKKFDEGGEVWAKPMATTLRILLHHTKESHSLLEQVGQLRTVTWIDTAAQMIPGNLAASNNLARMTFTVIDDQGNMDPSWTPALDDYQHRTFYNRLTPQGVVREPAAGRRLAFDEWWTMPVIRTAQGVDYSRQDLVMSVANTDGGSHVDPGLKEPHYLLSRTNLVGGVVDNSTGTVEMGSPVEVSIRQIAHEVLKSLT